MPQLKGRMNRIAAKNPNMTKGAVKRLATKRAASYKSRTSAQRSNAKAPAAHVGGGFGTSEKIGRGKKGTLKRKLWKQGGTKSELVALRSQTKATRKHIKKSARASNYDLRATASNLKKGANYRNAVLQSWRNA